MGVDRTRVLVLAAVTLVLIVAAAIVLDWHVVTILGQAIEIDLRTAHVCDARGACVSVPTQGAYSFFGALTMWGGLAFAGLVALIAGQRLVTGAANEKLSQTGYFIGAGLLLVTGITGYLFSPDFGVQIPDLVTTERTFAPLVMLGGTAAGIATCYYAIIFDSDRVDAPILTPARVLPTPQRTPTPPPARAPTPLPITPTPTPPPSARASTPIPVGLSRQSQPIVPIPAPLRGKLKYAVITAEITRAGIDARREDGKEVLVLWRDVVGVVARRMPPEYEGVTFVDLVSTAGMTLRLFSWTRLNGDPVEGEGDGRARSLVKLVAERCTTVKLDPATRAFVEGDKPAAQLKDLQTMCAHDDRLA